MSYFKQHVFVCCNQRDDGKECCHSKGASEMLSYLKTKVKAAGLSGAGQIRVSKSGCLGRCEEGPVMVVYPQAVWYTFIDESDIDDIFEQTLCQEGVVDRLRIDHA